jgi:hypothetical protein
VATYGLQPNEVVLLKAVGVAHGGILSVYTDELILTNLNLVLVKKGMFGNAKGVQVFPLNQIKVHERQAQAVLGKAPNGMDALDVYFLNGQEQFRFQSGGKRTILTWVAKINETVTGQKAPVSSAGSLAIPGAELVAGALKDTFDVFKGKFASKSAAPTASAGKCVACGAPMTGIQGQTLTCAYCGSAQQL